MTDALLSSSFPVFSVEGQVKGELARDLLFLEVEEDTAGMKRLCAHLVGIGPATGGPDERLQYLDGAILDFGKKLRASIGPPGGERTVFEGLVSALEAEFAETEMPRVAVFAEDQLMKLRMTHRMKTYRNVTDADIARAIASDHGLSADAAADGPTYEVVQQWNQSDLAFLRERARLVQAEIWLEGDSLKFKTRPNRSGTTLTLVAGNDLLDVSLRADLAHQRSSVRVSGYNAQEREAIEESAGDDAIQAEISSGRSGPSILSVALGERTTHRVREAPLTGTEARSWARAELLRRARQFVTVVATTRGSPEMVVGSRLSFERVGAPFEGSGYYVTRVRHTFDLKQGHRTHFSAERATVNGGAT